MAGDWIKITHCLPNKPEVLAIASKTGLSRFEVVGRLVVLWIWFDEHTTNGEAKGVDLATLDALLFCNAFVTLPALQKRDNINASFLDAVVDVGWLMQFDVGHDASKTTSICIKSFDKHQSSSAKKRAVSSRRQEKYRSNGEALSCNAFVTLGASLEKRREEKNNNTPHTPRMGGVDVVNDVRQTTASKPRQPRQTIPEGFGEFWAAYPRKVAKAAALKAWVKLAPGPELLATILADLKRRVDWTPINSAYVPHPATYLNGRRWEDETVISGNGKKSLDEIIQHTWEATS